MRIPQNRPYKKAFKGKIKGTESRGLNLEHGQSGIISLENGRLTPQQIEAARRAIVRYLKRSGKVWIRIFPDIPVSKKPNEIRMGKGKGSVDRWICRVRKNRVLFEVGGVPLLLAKRALTLGGAKLPVKTKWISKEE